MTEPGGGALLGTAGGDTDASSERSRVVGATPFQRCTIRYCAGHNLIVAELSRRALQGFSKILWKRT